MIVSPQNVWPFQLTSDAWAVLVAAFVGAIVSLGVVFIQQVLQNRARKAEIEAARGAVATAILFEIDDFYRYYIKFAMEELQRIGQNPIPPSIRPIPSTPFPVYTGNTAHLGELDKTIVSGIVHFYGNAQAYLSTLGHYKERYEVGLRGENIRGFDLARNVLPDIRKECEGLTALAFLVCGLLCAYTGQEFASPSILVAGDTSVSPDTRKLLNQGLKQLQEAGVKRRAEAHRH